MENAHIKKAARPGEILMTLLEVRNITPEELASHIDLPSDLITSYLPMTNDISQRLEKALGIDAEFWQRLQELYDYQTI